MVIADNAIWSIRKHFYCAELLSFMRIADRGHDLTKRFSAENRRSR